MAVSSLQIRMGLILLCLLGGLAVASCNSADFDAEEDSQTNNNNADGGSTESGDNIELDGDDNRRTSGGGSSDGEINTDGSTNGDDDDLVIEEGDSKIIRNGKCKTGHLIYFTARCNQKANAGVVNDCWNQDCKTFYAPVPEVCRSVQPGNWYNEGSVGICTETPLPKCPSDWRERDVRHCTLEDDAETEEAGDNNFVPKIEQNEEICPEKHRLYVQMCTLVNGRNTYENVGPIPEVCANTCHPDGSCPWQPVNDPGNFICVEEELPECTSTNVKNLGNRSCYLP